MILEVGIYYLIFIQYIFCVSMKTKHAQNSKHTYYQFLQRSSTVIFFRVILFKYILFMSSFFIPKQKVIINHTVKWFCHVIFELNTQKSYISSVLNQTETKSNILIDQYMNTVLRILLFLWLKV